MISAFTRPIRVLELRSVRGTGGGPEKTILLSAARSNPKRVQTLVCYIRDQRDQIFGIGERAAAMNVPYVEVLERHSLDLRAWSRLAQLVRENEIDIVHAHEYKTDLIAAFLARTTGAIPLATAHGWTGLTPRERRVYYPIDRLVLARLPRVIAVSGEIRQTLINAGARPDRVTTILNGIDPRAFRRDRAREAEHRRALGFGPRDIVIGCIGRLEPQKRFDLLLHAFASIRANRPELRLVIAGDGSLRAALEAQVKALELERSCRLLGHRADVVELHHSFDMFVTSSDYEGTPNAVLEAMALETPVVATDAGGTAELMDDGVHGRVVPCGDVEALIAAMDQALLDWPTTTNCAAAARRRIERHLSFDSRLNAVEAIYEELMEGRPGWSRTARPIQVA